MTIRAGIALGAALFALPAMPARNVRNFNDHTCQK